MFKIKYVLLITGLCLGLVFMAGCGKLSVPDNREINNNKPINFSDYRGKYILINYFASFCKPCWQEIPVLNSLSLEYASKVKIFGVNYDHFKTQQELNQAISKMGIKFSVLQKDPAEKFKWGEIQILPTTVIIDPQGKVVTIVKGEQTKQILLKLMNL